jgi:hypothetical protein
MLRIEEDQLTKIIAQATFGGRPAVGSDASWVDNAVHDLGVWLAERDTRILAAITAERLLDDTGESDDIAYNLAIDDVASAVTTVMGHAPE